MSPCRYGICVSAARQSFDAVGAMGAKQERLYYLRGIQYPGARRWCETARTVATPSASS